MITEVSTKEIEQKIYFVRGHRVMTDNDLSAMYGVDTGALNRSVRRNISRFPGTFMFQLTNIEVENLKCQFGISSFGHHGGRRSLPLVFTEYGVVMLSSVLNSKRAIQVNIAVIQAFVRLREIMESHSELAAKIDKLERKYVHHDNQFKDVFEAIRQLLAVGSPLNQKKIKGLRSEE